MSFSSLPLETINNILSQLIEHPSDDKPFRGINSPKSKGPGPIYSLCLTNKSLNTLAKPLLCSHWRYRDVKALPAFVTQVLKCEKARQQVREVRLDDTVMGDYSYIPPLSLGEAEESTLRKAVASSLKMDEDAAQKLNMKGQDAAWAGLLMLLPNIEVLSLTVPNTDPSRIEAVLWAASAPRAELSRFVIENSPFSRLRRFELSHDTAEYTMHADLLVPMFKLPSLRSVHCTMVGIFAESEWRRSENVPKRTSGVEEIKWFFGDPDDATIRTLAGFCRSLRRLTLEWGAYYEDETEFSIEAIKDAILMHSDSLEELVIDTRESAYLDNEGDEDGISFHIGTALTEMKVLRKLEIDQMIVLDSTSRLKTSLIDMLPRSLEYFSIDTRRQCEYETKELLVSELIQLVHNSGNRGRFPSLQIINLA